MAVEQKTVMHGKEASDVMAFIVEIVRHFKEGKSLSEITELIDELIEAINGIDQLDDEFKSNRQAVLNSILLGASDLVEVLLPQEASQGPQA